jgi:hypothetical protein
MFSITKYLLAAATAAGIVFAGQTAAAQDFRWVPTAGPVPGFTPNIYPYPPVPPRWPHIWPPVPRPPIVAYDFAVYVRVGGFVGWREYGIYDTRWQAERVARMLQLRGHPTRIIPVERPRILGR